jgi:hypothetical protein
MPKKKITHPAAVERITSIADTYVPVSGDDPADFAGDLMADLQHWCKAEGVRFDVALRRAQMHLRPSKTWGYSGCLSKRSTGPTLGDRIVSVQGFVHGSSADFQHQMRTPRRPTHLLPGVHAPM